VLESLRTSRVVERLTKHEIVKQFVKYGVVGVLNVAIFFAIYDGLRLADTSTLVARAAAFVTTSFISFRLNKSWSFRDPRRHAVVRQYFSFLGFTAVGFALHTVLFTLFRIPLKRFGLLGENLALLCALPFSVLWNFTGYRYWVFRESYRAPSSF
jgi:putative flippase GtrA